MTKKKTFTVVKVPIFYFKVKGLNIALNNIQFEIIHFVSPFTRYYSIHQKRHKQYKREAFNLL